MDGRGSKLKCSVITPEHSPDNIPHLLELYESLCDQTYDNWEWILYLNNRCTLNHVPERVRNDPRVTIVEAHDDTNKNIGHIKNKAFHHGTGDILVEVDHDDMITPDCLEELVNAFESDKDVGFVYSDDAILQTSGEFVPYNPDMGWTWTNFEWKGRTLKTMRSFEPSSHSLAYIWYAPDHVRSWRADLYRALGGHNPDLAICDDHELCIRTFLVTKMKRIPKVLYIYRITGDNTWLERNADIQIKTRQLCHEYAQRLAERDASLKGLQCIDIGGGLNPYPNYTVVDLRDNADIRCDLDTDGIPLPDNSVGVVNASHIIEHLHDKNKIMAEIHRVLAPGGWAFIEVPSTDGRGAFQDPTHVTYWNENSFLYYTDAYLARFIDNTTTRFMAYRMETHYPNPWMESLKVSVTTAWLVAVKDSMPRLPGELKI